MNILKLTAKDFKKSDSYWSDYIGKEDVTNYDGAIEIDGNLGWARFKYSLKASLSILAKAGTGIIAGRGIESGEGIKAGGGIEAGWGIKAGWGIEAGRGIKTGDGIEAGRGIKAGGGIESGEGIKAGGGIEAGWGIKAGGGIKCKHVLKARYNVFAGTATWEKAEGEDMTVTCGKLEANVAYGIVKELGMESPSLSGKTVTVTLDGKTYEATIK